jgi:hypothetical protein
MPLSVTSIHKTLVLLITIIGLGACTASKTERNYLNSPDYVVWSEEPLEWSDFKGQQESVDHTAYINWGIAWMKDHAGKWNIFAHFSKRTSWYSLNSARILRHEQYHFNLAEVYARLIRQEVITKKITPGTLAFDKTFKTYLDECRYMQSRYDKQTMHALDKIQQLDWERRIDNQLDTLKHLQNIVVEF